jgi:hypothetical protein
MLCYLLARHAELLSIPPSFILICTGAASPTTVQQPEHLPAKGTRQPDAQYHLFSDLLNFDNVPADSGRGTVRHSRRVSLATNPGLVGLRRTELQTTTNTRTHDT